jgi:hypothetical protein
MDSANSERLHRGVDIGGHKAQLISKRYFRVRVNTHVLHAGGNHTLLATSSAEVTVMT